MLHCPLEASCTLRNTTLTTAGHARLGGRLLSFSIKVYDEFLCVYSISSDVSDNRGKNWG